LLLTKFDVENLIQNVHRSDARIIRMLQRRRCRW